MGNQAKGKIVL